MKILVTGAAGFIGSNFVYYLLENHQNDEIIGLDVLTYAGNLENLKNALNHKNFTFVKGDICDKEFIEDIFKKYDFDYVVNFAAESHVDRSTKDPGIFLKTNIIGTQILMDECLKYPKTRFHQVSTDEVYGDLPLDRPDLLFSEDTPLHASSPYSASKAAADLMVLAYHRTFKLNATISRCSNNYGPYQFPEKLIPLMINNALSNKKLPVYGKGINVRDWLHVYDHCSAIDLIMRNSVSGSVYNVGGNNERKNIEVVLTILKQLNKSEDLITYVTDRKGHDLRYGINADKIKNELGWSAKYNFENGIKETINWYLENKEWLENTTSGEYINYYNKMYNNR